MLGFSCKYLCVRRGTECFRPPWATGASGSVSGTEGFGTPRQPFWSAVASGIPRDTALRSKKTEPKRKKCLNISLPWRMNETVEASSRQGTGLAGRISRLPHNNYLRFCTKPTSKASDKLLSNHVNSNLLPCNVLKKLPDTTNILDWQTMLALFLDHCGKSFAAK